MSEGILRYVCVSSRKGGAKDAVARAELRSGHGIVGDAHAGPWHRQLSILDEADIDAMRAKGLALEPGAFGENLVVAGLDLASVGIGTVLAVGAACLGITQIGKVCHERCPIFYAAGDCIMPRLGLFAEVRRGATITPGEEVRVEELVPRSAWQAGVLTVSDRCAAGTMRDTAGPVVASTVAASVGAHVAWAGIVPDEVSAIERQLRDLVGRGLSLIVTVGGTGLAPRDVTPEATLALIEREVPGLAEAMRATSAASTPNAWLSRAVAGTAGTTLIVNLPGSERAARENLLAIVPALRHALAMLAGEQAHSESDAGRATPARGEGR